MRKVLIWSTYLTLCVLIVASLIRAASNPSWLALGGALLLLYFVVVVLDVTQWRDR